MIYDIFTFNNEMDMLDLRLKILSPYVDYFVLVEANTTFSGVEKPLVYQENKERFKEYENKIIHYSITDSPTSFDNTEHCDQEILEMGKASDNVTMDHFCWLGEFYQKECIKKALVDLNDDDICYVSDLDEIWNYDLKFDVDDDKIYKPMIDRCYIEYLNVRTSENWRCFTGPIVTKYKNIKNECLNHLRTLRKMESVYHFIQNGGWHFNALGGVQKKMDDFKHPVYHPAYMETRKIGWRVDEEGLPVYILQNKEELTKKGLFYDKNRNY